MSGRLDAFAERLGYQFSDRDLLRQALTHSSVTQRRLKSNERMEFLGDRVLGLILAEMLLETFPAEEEGAIAYRFTALAQRDALATVANTIGIAEVLTLSDGERTSGGLENPGVLADAVEAVIAAIYIDGGLDPAQRFIRAHWAEMMREDRRPPKDPKTTLQEWAQGNGLPLPNYRVVEQEGPDHQPVFTVEAEIKGRSSVSGQGNSKRAAEQAAAEAMLATIEEFAS